MIPKISPELDQKLETLEIPGQVLEVEPDEADALGAFEEEALSEEDAAVSAIDEHQGWG